MRSEYCKTIDHIKATPELKNKLINRMMKAQTQNPVVTPIERRKKRNIWLMPAAIAVCCVCIFILPMFTKSEIPLSPFPPDLPKLTVPTGQGEGMGFEAMMAYNIDDLANGNPWQEGMRLETLPVFKNPTPIGNAGIISGKGLSADEMTVLAKKAASNLGLTIDSTIVHPSEAELKKTGQKVPAEVIAVEVQCGNTKITVERTGTIQVFFGIGTSRDVPEGLSFGHGNAVATIDKAQETTLALTKEYQKLVSLKHPALNVWSAYSFSGERNWLFEAYEGTGTITDQILNYNFNTIQFGPDDEGKLFIIWINHADLSQKIGDYPIISLAEGKDLLSQGHYLTTVPEEFPGKDYVKKVELVYKKQISSEVFMPFYRFYVEMPTMQLDNGLKTYGIYYVPAVQSEYLSGLPENKSEFN